MRISFRQTGKFLKIALGVSICYAIFGNLDLHTEFIEDQSMSAVSVSMLSESSASRRYFLNYTSSEWEILWLKNIDAWTKSRSICEKIMSKEQRKYLSFFMKTLCTSQFNGTPWCLVDDSFKPYWFNEETFEIFMTPPGQPPESLGQADWASLKQASNATPIIPNETKTPLVFSRFDFFDHVTGLSYSEYIEPLVSHLRHPLSQCHPNVSFISRSYIIPPPPMSIKATNYSYFDAGASTWDRGIGGPSLSYFTTVWGRHGYTYDSIEAWEGSTKPEKFYKTVPDDFKKRTIFHQEWVAKNRSGSPFIPQIIANKTKKTDYVLFKLDIDGDSAVEQGIVKHLLSFNGTNDLSYITEFAWEDHVENYLMNRLWGPSRDKSKSISQSYQPFLEMRKRGVRAHSWV